MANKFAFSLGSLFARTPGSRPVKTKNKSTKNTLKAFFIDLVALSASYPNNKASEQIVKFKESLKSTNETQTSNKVSDNAVSRRLKKAGVKCARTGTANLRLYWTSTYFVFS